jgi:hypothetical protein
MREGLIAAGVVALLAIVPASAAAAAPTRASDPFVCPVLTLPGKATDNSGQFAAIGDRTYTLSPGNAGDAETFNGNVPNTATNADGAGSPTANGHSSPGDTDYTAIWSGNG